MFRTIVFLIIITVSSQNAGANEPVWTRKTGAWTVALIQATPTSCIMHTRPTNKNRANTVFFQANGSGIHLLFIEEIASNRRDQNLMLDLDGKLRTIRMRMNDQKVLIGDLAVGSAVVVARQDIANARSGRLVLSGGDTLDLDMSGSRGAVVNFDACVKEMNIRNGNNAPSMFKDGRHSVQ